MVSFLKTGNYGPEIRHILQAKDDQQQAHKRNVGAHLSEMMKKMLKVCVERYALGGYENYEKQERKDIQQSEA